jgi:hypothetical protein
MGSFGLKRSRGRISHAKALAACTGAANVVVDQSEPGGLTGGKATTWVVRANEIDTEMDNWTVTAQVICATG